MTDSSIHFQKAVMIPVDDADNPDFERAIAVQFNPETLKVTQSNTLDTGNSGGGQNNAAQFIDKSESSLSIQLIFDTSIGRPQETISLDPQRDNSGEEIEGPRRTITAMHKANSDVRVLTKAIADLFMKPRDESSDRPKAPLKCRFQWGTFAFVGMMSSFDETLDFFAPEGIPLRATLSLSFKEDRYQFDSLVGGASNRESPSFAPGGDAMPVADVAKDAGKDPKDWRNTALFNGIEAPRFSASEGLSVPNSNISAGASLGSSIGAATAGFSAGASASLGTQMPGAFHASGSVNGSAAFASADVSVSGSIDADAELSAMSGGRFASASAMAAAGASANFSAQGSAQGSASARIDASSATAEFDIDTA